jgi:hypothetical protein
MSFRLSVKNKPRVQSVMMLSVIMRSVIMLIVIILNVVVPFNWLIFSVAYYRYITNCGFEKLYSDGFMVV